MHLETAGGDLRVSISSSDLALEGATIAIDPFGEVLTLQRVAPDQVGAEALIRGSARQGLAPAATVRLRVASPAQ